MKMRMWQLILMLIVFALCVGGYVVTFISFESIHRYFLTEYLLRRSWKLLIAFWIPAQWMALYCSLALRPRIHTDKNSPSHKNPVFLIIIISTMLFSGTLLFLSPQNERALSRIQYLSTYLGKLQDQSNTYAEKGNYELAAKSLESYLNLVKNDRVTEHRYQSFLERAVRTPPSEPPQEDLRGDSNTVAFFIQQSKNFFAQEDYVSAYYYASLADQLTVPPSSTIRDLMVRALSQLGEVSRLEIMQRSKYFRELAGARALQEGRVDPPESIIAYFIFYDLYKEYPQDQEILRYLNKSEDQLRRNAFFSEEAEWLRINPGVGFLTFLNKRSANTQEFISIDHLNFAESGSYAYGIEVLRLENMTPTTHFRAEYGKIIDDSIVFRAITPQREQIPLQYFLGTESPTDYEINYQERNIIALSTPREWRKTSHLFDLWKEAQITSPQSQRDLWLNIIQKFLSISLLLVGSLSVISTALHFPAPASTRQIFYYPLWAGVLFFGHAFLFTGINLIIGLILHLVDPIIAASILIVGMVGLIVLLISMIQIRLYKY